MQAWSRFMALCERMRSSRLMVLLLMVPNLLGIVYGYYFYYEVGQFDPSSPYFRSLWWWPFIPDSPNAVLLCSLALLWWAFGRRRSAILDGVAFTAMVYVGLWTTTLFLSYPDRMGTFDFAGVARGNANPVLFVTHMGMPIEALLLVPALLRDGRRFAVAAGVAAWNVLNVALDYWGPHLHPAPFVHMACAACYDPGLLPPADSPNDTLLHVLSPIVMLLALGAYGLVVRAAARKASVPDAAAATP